MPNLYIVATPIGNLGDMSQRGIDTLKSVDLILCEDTRVTKKLLSHFNISKSVLSYHHHSNLQKIEYILDLAGQGKNIALVSDAGTPGVSDPGNKLVEEYIKKFGNDAKIIPIPGASAVMASASVAGFAMDKFAFFGFAPHKNKRQKFFKEALAMPYPVIFFESTYRILKALEEINNLDSQAEIVVLREITKKFETHYRGKVGDALSQLKQGIAKGEFAIILKNNR